MTEQVSYSPDEVRHIASDVDAALDAYAGRAKDRVLDAAQNQGEEKWGGADLGAPATFGRAYSQRLTAVEDSLQKLSKQVEEFSHKVQEAAARAHATDEEIAEALTLEEHSLPQPEAPRTFSQPQTGVGNGFTALG